MEENQPECGATSSGGLGTDDTTLIERVELSSFVAAGDCLLVHLSKSKFLHVLEVPRQPYNVLFFRWRSKNKLRETQLPRTKGSCKSSSSMCFCPALLGHVSRLLQLSCLTVSTFKLHRLFAQSFSLLGHRVDFLGLDGSFRLLHVFDRDLDDDHMPLVLSAQAHATEIEVGPDMHLGELGRHIRLLDHWSLVAASPQRVYHSVKLLTLRNLHHLPDCLDCWCLAFRHSCRVALSSLAVWILELHRDLKRLSFTNRLCDLVLRLVWPCRLLWLQNPQLHLKTLRGRILSSRIHRPHQHLDTSALSLSFSEHDPALVESHQDPCGHSHVYQLITDTDSKEPPPSSVLSGCLHLVLYHKRDTDECCVA